MRNPRPRLLVSPAAAGRADEAGVWIWSGLWVPSVFLIPFPWVPCGAPGCKNGDCGHMEWIWVLQCGFTQMCLTLWLFLYSKANYSNYNDRNLGQGRGRGTWPLAIPVCCFIQQILSSCLCCTHQRQGDVHISLSWIYCKRVRVEKDGTRGQKC